MIKFLKVSMAKAGLH